MRENREIAVRVRAAKRDPRAADELVRSYLPFIKAETAKFMGRPPREGRDDELGIAMFAFHEAVMSYDRSRGAFLPLAALSIKNRLIDFRRRERRHAEVLSLDERRSTADDEDDRPLVETLAAEKGELAEREARLASRAEIAEFAAQLKEFGITLFDVTESCPRQQRTLEACGRALAHARASPSLLERLLATKELPISDLARGSGVEKKTLERHRTYLVALLLAYTNGFEIIRGHLCKIVGSGGGDGR